MRILKASADLYFQNGAGRDDSFVSVLKVPTSAQGFIDGALLSVSASTELLCASAQLLKSTSECAAKVQTLYSTCVRSTRPGDFSSLRYFLLCAFMPQCFLNRGRIEKALKWCVRGQKANPINPLGYVPGATMLVKARHSAVISQLR
jgi:hypothetical protein